MLAQYQSDFVASVRNKQQVKPNEWLAPPSRIAVYQNNFHLGILSQLRKLYRLTEKQLGQAQFERLALHYLAQFPPEDENLNLYGAHFAHYLAHHQELPTEISTLADIEYAKQCSYYAPNNCTDNYETFVALSSEQQLTQPFIKQPTLFLVTAERWLLCYLEQPDTDDFYPQTDGDTAKVSVLIYRNEGKVEWQALPDALAALLLRFTTPTAINQLNDDEVQLFPTLFLRGWVSPHNLVL